MKFVLLTRSCLAYCHIEYKETPKIILDNRLRKLFLNLISYWSTLISMYAYDRPENLSPNVLLCKYYNNCGKDNNWLSIL